MSTVAQPPELDEETLQRMMFRKALARKKRKERDDGEHLEYGLHDELKLNAVNAEQDMREAKADRRIERIAFAYAPNADDNDREK